MYKGRMRSYYAMPYGARYIWGATARHAGSLTRVLGAAQGKPAGCSVRHRASRNSCACGPCTWRIRMVIADVQQEIQRYFKALIHFGGIGPVSDRRLHHPTTGVMR